MTQYNSLNVNLSNSQLNKLKSEIKNETEVVLRLSSNMIGDNETNFPHKLLLTNRQVANLRKAFANYLSNFEIQTYYRNEPRFNGVYFRDNIPKIKDGTYVINLDEYSDIGTHWVALYVGSASPKDVNNDVTYFDSFGEEYIPKEIKAFTDRSLSITTNIFRIQAYDSIMC